MLAFCQTATFRTAGVTLRPEDRLTAPNCSACSPSGDWDNEQPICPHLTRIGMYLSALHFEMALGSPSWGRAKPLLQYSALAMAPDQDEPITVASTDEPMGRESITEVQARIASEPASRSDDHATRVLRTALIGKPGSPPAERTVGDDVVPAPRHQHQILPRVSADIVGHQDRRLIQNQMGSAPLRIIRKNKVASSFNRMRHLPHGIEVIGL